MGSKAARGQDQNSVSIGTGVLSLKSFQDDIFYRTLAAIATETEQAAEIFRRVKPYFAKPSQYYRFNVASELEDIRLEESKKRKEVAAITRQYLASEEVFKQTQACARSLARRECQS